MKLKRLGKDPKDSLKPLNAEIQICPVCYKIDVYKDDGHSCEGELVRQENEEYYWDD